MCVILLFDREATLLFDSPWVQLYHGDNSSSRVHHLFDAASFQFARDRLEDELRRLVLSLGTIQIGGPQYFPYGWRKAAKGRTVWRILEEIITQNLEWRQSEFGIAEFAPASSEVAVFDFALRFEDAERPVFVNVKSSLLDGRSSKDDISKAAGLLDFFHAQPDAQLFVATFMLEFVEETMGVRIADVAVVPTSWLPDVYVNPSNNGNLQSAHYKSMDRAVPRSNPDFVALLRSQVEVAKAKRARA